MNEVELIHTQMQREQRHFFAAAAACRGALATAAATSGERSRLGDPLAAACADYLTFIGSRLAARSAALQEQPRASTDAVLHLAVRSLAAALAAFRAQTETCAGSPAAGLNRALGDFLAAIPAVAPSAAPAQTSRSIGEWRRIAGVDADSILEERRRFAALEAEFAASSGDD